MGSKSEIGARLGTKASDTLPFLPVKIYDLGNNKG